LPQLGVSRAQLRVHARRIGKASETRVSPPGALRFGVGRSRVRRNPRTYRRSPPQASGAPRIPRAHVPQSGARVRWVTRLYANSFRTSRPAPRRIAVVISDRKGHLAAGISRARKRTNASPKTGSVSIQRMIVRMMTIGGSVYKSRARRSVVARNI